MCGENFWACRDCGARRFVFWDNCEAYWAQYTHSVQNGRLDARPKPEDCSGYERVLMDTRLGTCPKLGQCDSKYKHKARQLRMRRLRHIVRVQRQEEEARQRRQMEAFAQRHFCKRPVPAAPRETGVGFANKMLADCFAQRAAEQREQQQDMASEHERAKAVVKQMLRRRGRQADDDSAVEADDGQSQSLSCGRVDDQGTSPCSQAGDESVKPEDRTRPERIVPSETVVTVEQRQRRSRAPETAAVPASSLADTPGRRARRGSGCCDDRRVTPLDSQAWGVDSYRSRA